MSTPTGRRLQVIYPAKRLAQAEGPARHHRHHDDSSTTTGFERVIGQMLIFSGWGPRI
ncbi:MAG: hypothetical protein WA814_00030 [Candidatus Baltobacteraceae bacterium]